MSFVKVLLTGALGNVGSSMVHEILLSGDKPSDVEPKVYWNNVHLIAVDIKNPRTEAVYEKIISSIGEGREDRRFTMEWCDLTNEAAVYDVISRHRPHVVLHIAAFIPPNCYSAPPGVAYKVNVLATKNLLKACNNVTVNEQGAHPHFVFSSSYSVQGPQDGTIKDLPLFSDKSPINPVDVYGNHKRICEEMIQAIYKGKWTILRFGAILPIEGSMTEGTGDTVFDFLFTIPYDQKRHGCDTRDVGFALAMFSKIYRDDPTCGEVASKILMIGGNETWCTTAGDFCNKALQTLGLYALPKSAFRTPSTKEAWYYENYMDTIESQRILKFQRYSFDDYLTEKRNRVGSLQYYATALVAIFAYIYLIFKSHYFWKGEHYQGDLPLHKIISGLEIPEKEKKESGKDHI